MDLFNKNEYLRLRKNLKKIFFELVQELEKKSKNDNLAPFVGDLEPLLDQKWCQFTKFHPVLFYFLSELQTFYLLVELYLEKDEDSIEILYEELGQSIFSEDFVRFVDTLDERKAIEQTLLKYREQLLAFYNNHLTTQEKKPYVFLPELGDRKIGGKILFPRFEIIEHGKLKIKLANDQDFQRAADIKHALTRIEQASPKSFERLRAFTRVLIPSDREEIVSYSSQYLPGYSVINMKHRDQLDLIDDLLHENGHHHLNHYLWIEDLFEENPEEIFYSPWRKSPRPIRGIYHGVFTFYFAQQIYFDLAMWCETDSHDFTEAEQEKIYDRLIEESLMLETTFDDIDWAYKQGWIYESGYELIKTIVQYIKNNISGFTQLNRERLNYSEAKFASLKNELSDKKSFYQKG